MTEKFGDRLRASWAVFRGRAKAIGRKQRSGSIKKRGIDAAKMTGPNRLWSGSKGDANFDVTAGLVKTRSRSRDAYMNFPYIRQMVDRWVDGLVGNGLRPTPLSGDSEWDGGLGSCGSGSRSRSRAPIWGFTVQTAVHAARR